MIDFKNFKIKRGPSKDLHDPRLIVEEGYWYLSTDKAELFIGIVENGTPVLKPINGELIPEVNLEGYATEDFVREAIKNIDIPEVELYDDTELRNLINSKADKEHTHEEYSLIDHKHDEYLTAHQDISHLATKEEIPNLDGYAKLENIPDVSKFITEIPAVYVTETELENKGYLTEHQSLVGYATESYVLAEIAKAALEGNDIDLSAYATKEFVAEEINKLEIPEAYDDSELRNLINSKANSVHSHEEYALAEHTHDEYLTEHQSLADYAKKTDLFSKSYNDLTDKPTIPSIEGLATEQYVTEAIAAIQEPVEQVQTRLNTEVLPKVNKVDEIVPVVETLKTTAATQEWVQEQKYTTEEYVDNAISNIHDNIYKYTLPRQFGDGDVLPVTEELLDFANRLEQGEDVYLRVYDYYGTKYANARANVTANYIDLTIIFESQVFKTTTVPFKTSLSTETLYWTIVRSSTIENCVSEPLSLAVYDSGIEGSRLKAEIEAKIPSMDGVATEKYVDEAIANIEHPANPTKVSELENDAKYTNETKVLELIENNASAKIGIDFVTDITVGHLVAGTQISKDMTIGQILYNMLFAGTPVQPEEPSNPEGVVAEIISKQLPMYSVKKDGTIAADDFKLFTLTSEEATQAPTESGFYQIIDESNTVIESGYQELQIASDELYYVIALPKSVDYNSDMVKIQAYDDDEKIWNDCDKLPLINDPTKVSSLCNEAGIDISHIDTNVYTVWALEDICTGSKLRYIIIG